MSTRRRLTNLHWPIEFRARYISNLLWKAQILPDTARPAFDMRSIVTASVPSLLGMFERLRCRAPRRDAIIVASSERGRTLEAKYLRIPEVLQRYGIGRTTIYDLVAKSKFPRPIHVGRSALWSIDEFTRFEDAKSLEREPNAPGDVDWRENPSASTPSGVPGAGE